jgi:hypothetical protein
VPYFRAERYYRQRTGNGTEDIYRKRNTDSGITLPHSPFIHDTKENFLDYCREIGVYGILFFGFDLTPREGNREYFYEKPHAYFRGLKEMYQKTYGLSYEIRSKKKERLYDSSLREYAKSGIITSQNKRTPYLYTYEQPYVPAQERWF